MSSLTQYLKSAILSPLQVLIKSERTAMRLTKTTTKNKHNNPKPKFRGIKRREGHMVTAGTTLCRQRGLRWFPGLNVGLGRNGNLFAIIPGRVKLTHEKVDLNWEHNWAQRLFGDRRGVVFYKKYFHVIPVEQHRNFKLMDAI